MKLFVNISAEDVCPDVWLNSINIFRELFDIMYRIQGRVDTVRYTGAIRQKAQKNFKNSVLKRNAVKIEDPVISPF